MRRRQGQPDGHTLPPCSYIFPWGEIMARRALWTLVAICLLFCTLATTVNAQQPNGFGRTWGARNTAQDWNRFYHYPYVYYPHNFWSSEYFKSRDSMYYRYPPEMRIPVYNKRWHNPFPAGRPYHFGHHFILDQL